MEIFDLSTLITIAIAVFVFLRLRSVLGTRTGSDNRQNRKPNGSAGPLPPEASDVSNDNVVTLPRHKTARDGEAPAKSEAEHHIDEIAKPRTKLNKAMKTILSADPNFDPKQFLEGSKMAYEMIVTAFADGDRKTLKSLLSREVFDGFANVISERESSGYTIQSSFVGIDDASIKDAGLTNSDAHVTVRFVSEIVSATYNQKKELIDGDPEQVAEVIDIWTFARDLHSGDPNWNLVATESGG